jgi:hypothetical protein
VFIFLKPDQFNRPPVFGILCAFARVVQFKPVLYVRGVTGVIGFISALKDVNIELPCTFKFLLHVQIVYQKDYL